jgi:hypothetical protein
VDGKLILEFRVWDTSGSAYVWSRAWTDRYQGCDGLSLKIDDSGQGYGGFYPDITKLRVRNDDRFWDRLAKTAPLLADGGNITLGYTEPYRTGFRGRLVRLIESTSGTERTLFTGAVDDLSTSARGAAEIAVIGLHRLAMEQKGDAEKVDNVTAYGEWTAATGALYRSRVALGNGGYDVECFRHKRVKALFERTKMPRMDASVVAENVKLSTYDARRTVTAVSLPEGLSFVGFVWGDPNADIAYVVGTATGTTKLYSYSYATGEVTYLLTLNSELSEIAWCGMHYNPHKGDSGQLVIPCWLLVPLSITTTPRLYLYDIATNAVVRTTDMHAFAAAITPTSSPAAATTFVEFLHWTPARYGSASTNHGTLWILCGATSSTANPVMESRLIELDPWDIATAWPGIVNDSGNKYRGTDINAYYLYWPASCANYTEMTPLTTPHAAGDITVYIFAKMAPFVGGTPYAHEAIFLLQLTSGVWQTAARIHYDATHREFTRFGCIAETPVGLMFTSAAASDWTIPERIVSKLFAEFGAANPDYVVREPEFWPGDNGYTETHPYVGTQFVYNYRDDRVYYGTGHIGLTRYNWNARLRSVDAASNTTGPRDENCNPAAMTVGDPPTDQASSFQVGTALIVRYKTSTTDWELHGVLVSPLESDVMMTYSKTYYPCVPLFDVRGRTLWQLRQLLAGASYCYFAYDGDGTLRLFQRAGVTIINPWSAEEPTVDSHGLSEVVNRWSAVPYLVGTSQDTREAEVISQAVALTSTGCVLNIKTGRVNATVTYRMTFTDATHYLLDKLVTGAWVTACASTPIDITTAFTNADLGISPDCFAGTFVAGDTFTFCVYNSLPVLNQQAAYNKIEVADTASETTWGRTEAKFDNPFLPRAQTIDVLTQVLLWTARPHRAFTLGVVPYRYVGLLEARNLTTARETYSAMAVGWTRKLGNSPRKMLTLLET